MRKLLVVLAATVMVVAGCVMDQQPRPVEKGTSVDLTVVDAQGTTYVLAPVHIEGKGPYQFLLDTGASISTIDQQLAEELGLKFTGRTAGVMGVAGRTNVELIRVEQWRVGNVSLDAGRMAALDLPRHPRNVSGLLGSDVLRDFGWITVDYERERLVVPASAETVTPENRGPSVTGIALSPAWRCHDRLSAPLGCRVSLRGEPQEQS